MENNPKKTHTGKNHRLVVPELTVSGLGHQLGGSSDGLGENPHDAFAHSRDDPSGLAPSGALQVPAPLEVLHGMVHDAGYRAWRTRGRDVVLLFHKTTK